MTVVNLETELREMSERSVLFRIIKEEMVRRGHWKNLDRGSNRTRQELSSRRFTALGMQPQNPYQVQTPNDGFLEQFSDGM